VNLLRPLTHPPIARCFCCRPQTDAPSAPEGKREEVLEEEFRATERVEWAKARIATTSGPRMGTTIRLRTGHSSKNRRRAWRGRRGPGHEGGFSELHVPRAVPTEGLGASFNEKPHENAGLVEGARGNAFDRPAAGATVLGMVQVEKPGEGRETAPHRSRPGKHKS